MSAPTSRNDKLCFLIDRHLAFGSDVLEIDGTFPVHIDIGSAMIASANTIHAVGIDANLAVVEVFGIGSDRDDGQVVVVVAIDVTAGNDGTWEHAFLEKAETIDCGF